jgi:O-antigen/teichoic acid export membrane protein
MDSSERIAPAAGVGLRPQILRGVAWKGGSQVFGYVTRFTVAAILAHLLSPHDYGLAAMVLAFSALVYLFSDLSFGTALIQRREITEADRSTVFWTSVGAGALFTLIGFAAAGPIASFYGEPEVEPLFRALSLTFVIAALSSTQLALLTRSMDFRTLELREIAATLVAGACGITAALAGLGPWALILQQVAASVTSTVLLWICTAWRPHLRFSRASLRDLGGFSANVFGARLLFFANRNVDNILIGRFLGPAALGAYAIAYNLMLIPLSQISIPLQDVLFPAFSRMQHDVARIKAGWLRANLIVGSITIPAMVGLILVADDFVAVVLGDQWDSAVPVLQILAWVGLLQSLQGLNGSVLRALDRTATLLRYSVVAVIAATGAVIVGLPHGIVGVAAAYAIVSTVVEPFYTWLTTRALGSSLWEAVRLYAGVVQAVALMAVCVLVTKVALTAAEAGPFVQLLATVGVGIAVYLPALRWREPQLLQELRSLRRRAAAPAAT